MPRRRETEARFGDLGVYVGGAVSGTLLKKPVEEAYEAAKRWARERYERKQRRMVGILVHSA